MKLNCDQVENKIIDYIEGVLAEKERTAMDNHLKTCAACREDYQQQLAWLEKLSILKEKEAPARQMAPDLNARILQAVTEEKDRVKPAPANKSYWFRQRSFWRTAAMTAAALVLVIGGIQIISHLNKPAELASRRENTLGVQGEPGALDINSQGDFAAKTGRDESGVPGRNGDEQERVTDAAISSVSQWKLYSGSMAEMPVAGEMFSDDVTIESDFSTPPVKIDAEDEMYAAFELFSQAEAVRVLYTEKPDASVMFLLLWPQNEVETRKEELKDAFRPCIYPYSIEIIEKENLGLLLNELGPDLYRQITAELDLEQGGLIKVLIEE